MKAFGIIGVGGLGSALVKGILEAKLYSADDIIVFDKISSTLQNVVENLKVSAAKTIEEIAKEADVLVLAVKPKDLLTLIGTISPFISSEQTLISVAAGVRIESIAKHLVHEKPLLIRAMPNACAAVRLSMTALVAKKGSEKGLEKGTPVFEAIGDVVILENEALLDPVTALAGSGPAFLFTILEALADGGVKAGLSRSVAKRMAAQVMKGSAEMALSSGHHTAELKDIVASPAGTTISGLAVLESRGVRGAMLDAVCAASDLAKKLGEK